MFQRIKAFHLSSNVILDTKITYRHIHTQIYTHMLTHIYVNVFYTVSFNQIAYK